MKDNDANKTKEELLQELQGLRTQLAHYKRLEQTAEHQRIQADGLRVINQELQRIQHQLRSSQTFLEAIVENIPDMIFVKDAKELRFVRLNQAGTDLLGYSVADLLGKNDYDFFPTDEADFFTEKDRAVLESGTLLEIPEEPIHTRFRGIRYLWTKKVPIFDPDTQEPRFLLGISQDITEKKVFQEELKAINEDLEKRVQARTEELSEVVALLHRDIAERQRVETRLRASESWNRKILEALPGGILHVGLDGQILKANQKALNFFQKGHISVSSLRLQQLESRSVWEDGTPCRTEDMPASKALRTQTPQGPVTLGKKRPDGSMAWASYTAIPLQDSETEQITGVVLTFLDVTEKKAQEEEQKKFEAQLQHAQKLESLGVLAGGIAHDFNNLLVGILGNAEIMLEELEKGSLLYRRGQQIVETAVRASDLTRQLLAYAGKGKFQIQPIHLSLLAEEVAHLLQAAIAKNVVLQKELAPDLPNVAGDSTQIQQVLMNLLTNAAESYGGRGGVVIIRTGQTDLHHRGMTDSFTGTEIHTGRYVFLEVTDRGVGMDEATQAKIFDPFYTTKFTGRGLGLAAVMGIVRSHQGMIKIASEPGKGTIFTVFFPALESEQALHVATPSPEPMPSLEAWHGSTVLVVDDDPVVRSVTHNMLSRMGFQTLLAYDGQQGLLKFIEHQDKIALVLLDLTMPQMGGEEAFREMKKVKREIPIVLCSGYTQEEAINLFSEQGISGFLEKPFTRKSLVQKLMEVFSSKDPA